MARLNGSTFSSGTVPDIYEELTYAQAASKKSASEVEPGVLYKITDKDIWIEGIASNSYNNLGVHTRGFSAEGWVQLTGGAGGSVDDITINGVSIMSSSVAFTSSLEATAALVVANINAHTSSPNYTALQAGDYIIIFAADLGDDPNGYTVAASTTTITTSKSDMALGIDNNVEYFDIVYDFDNDSIIEMADKQNNRVACSLTYQGFFGENTIDIFPWNYAAQSANNMVNNVVIDSRLEAYAIASSVRWMDNYINGVCLVYASAQRGEFSWNVIEGPGAPQTYTFRGTGNVHNNEMFGAFTSIFTGTQTFTGNRCESAGYFEVSGNADVGGNRISNFSRVIATDDSVCNGAELWNESIINLSNEAKISNSKFNSTELTSTVTDVNRASNDIYAIWSEITLSDTARAARLRVFGSSGVDKGELDASGSTTIDGAVIKGGRNITVTSGDYRNMEFSSDMLTENSDASYSATYRDRIISYQRSDTGTGQITLPAINSAIHGQKVTIKDADYNCNANNITVDTTGSDTIEEVASYTMNIDGQSITIVANDTTKNWEII